MARGVWTSHVICIKLRRGAGDEEREGGIDSGVASSLRKHGYVRLSNERNNRPLQRSEKKLEREGGGGLWERWVLIFFFFEEG